MKPHEAMVIVNFLNDLIASISGKNKHVGKGFDYYEYTFQTTDEFLIEHLQETIKTIKKDIDDNTDYKREVFDLLLAVQLPGIESIEVNESQKKFVARYFKGGTDNEQHEQDDSQRDNVQGNEQAAEGSVEGKPQGS